MIFRSGDEEGRYDDWANGHFQTVPFKSPMVISQGDQYLVSLDQLSMDFFPGNITRGHFFVYTKPGEPEKRATFSLVAKPTFVDSPANLVELIKANIPTVLEKVFFIDFDVKLNRIVITVKFDDDQHFVYASLPLTLMLGFDGDVIFRKGPKPESKGIRPPNLFCAFETIFIECPTMCENVMIGNKSRPLLTMLLPNFSKTQQESFHVNTSFAAKRWVPLTQNVIESLEFRFTDVKSLPIHFVNSITGPCVLELVFKKKNIQFL